MRETEAEALVRDTFRSREHLVHAGHESLVEAVRNRTRALRGRGVVATGVTALAALLALSLAAVAVAVRGDEVHNGLNPPVVGGLPAPPADGWRWESSLGAQIMVPADWGRDDYGCNMTAKPSVVRAGGGSPRACLTPEPPSKEVAFIEGWPPAGESVEGPPEPDLPERGITVDGISARRAEGRLPDGRYTGWITVQSRHVRVIVRVLTAETATRILDSLRLVDVDHVGCPTQRPTRIPPGPRSDSFVPAEPTAISICNYLRDPRLQSSIRLTGAAALEVAATLNAAPPGPNPPASNCLDGEPPVPGVFLLVHAPAGVTTVGVTYQGCSGRGANNGIRQVHVTMALIHQMMRPLGGGYAFNGDIPG